MKIKMTRDLKIRMLKIISSETVDFGDLPELQPDYDFGKLEISELKIMHALYEKAAIEKN